MCKSNSRKKLSIKNISSDKNNFSSEHYIIKNEREQQKSAYSYRKKTKKKIKVKDYLKIKFCLT